MDSIRNICSEDKVGTYVEHDLHMIGDTLLVSKSDIGMRIWTCKMLVRHKEVKRSVDDSYIHIITHTWVVRGTIVHHVGMMGFPQCALCGAAVNGRGYVLPLDLELAGTGY